MSKQYSAPPALQIDPRRQYLAVFHTERGDFQVELFAAQAPATVNNFVFLARDGKLSCQECLSAAPVFPFSNRSLESTARYTQRGDV